jgi:Asp-tRNA(Asn)/Glu-tRNA(Gln) amidotransferase A subunit family amidase
MKDDRYDLKSVKLPRLTGTPLRILTALLECPITRGLLIDKLMRDAGVTYFRELHVDEPPTPFSSLTFAQEASRPQAAIDLHAFAKSKDPVKGFAYATVRDYAEAYQAGTTTPEAVAERIIGAIKESDAGDPPLLAFIAYQSDDMRAQAQASTRRFRDGRPLGMFDGVPVAVKDEVDQVPYPTTVGTRFLGKVPAREDATVVARMRAAGALLIGKTNMHEIGIGVTGLNPHHGTPRNPYDHAHFTGGSSSGSAAAVAAGICPVAIGADGGGSIRIPAAFCGVIGLKPTFSRVSEFGAAPLDWSVAHLGPIAATARDAAMAYALMAGPDPKDPLSVKQPRVTLEGFDDLDLKSLKLGVYWPWFRHATPGVVEQCESMLKRFEELGAEIIEIELPGLEAARIAHVITISSEMLAGMEPYYAMHQKEFGLDVRINLALAHAFSSRDYIKAQRIRTRLIESFSNALKLADAIVTPTTGCVAPSIKSDALPDGESDLSVLIEIMRFANPANFTGLPAITFPAGYDQGLPVGFQVMGRPWEEHVLLRLAHAAAQVVERKAPHVHFNILSDIS